MSRSIPKPPLAAVNGFLLVVLLALAAQQLAGLDALKPLGLSPLVVGILVGTVWANTLGSELPPGWAPGLGFSSRFLLRVAIVFYGFGLTFQQIGAVGAEGLVLSVAMVGTTFLWGTFLGRKVLGLDRETTLLTCAGSAICGAAAVLATEPVVRAEPHKSTLAVGTVVLFGTLSLVLYPTLHLLGILPMSAREYGLYTGGTVHEVAQVVAASSAVGKEAASVAIVVKMTRVLLLAPTLLILGLVLTKTSRLGEGTQARPPVAVPWFAVLFLVSTGIHSLGLVPIPVVDGIHSVDAFLLTVAMTALGMETHGKKVRQAGIRPLLLALGLFLWLVVGGYFLTKAVVTLC